MTHRTPTVVVEGEGGVDSNGDDPADEPDVVDEVSNAHSPRCEGRRARRLPWA